MTTRSVNVPHKHSLGGMASGTIARSLGSSRKEEYYHTIGQSGRNFTFQKPPRHLMHSLLLCNTREKKAGRMIQDHSSFWVALAIVARELRRSTSL
eukprot:scaffold7349_cov173-Amphora_coffeaeformis.AAC.58